jgi:hypothetical protein
MSSNHTSTVPPLLPLLRVEMPGPRRAHIDPAGRLRHVSAGAQLFVAVGGSQVLILDARRQLVSHHRDGPARAPRDPRVVRQTGHVVGGRAPKQRVRLDMVLARRRVHHVLRARVGREAGAAARGKLGECVAR